ncbi:MAG: hypothetical protein GC150_07570 [Rhizobiales bacterium]|nr:hypothetical protein [Hyphomicrobiales bacterium]
MRILALEDDIYHVLPIYRAIKERAHDLTTVETLGEAVRAVNEATTRKTPFEAYIIDLQIPGADTPQVLKAYVDRLGIAPVNRGQAFLTWLRANHHVMPFVFLTANAGFFDPNSQLYEGDTKQANNDRERIVEKYAGRPTEDIVDDILGKLAS